MTCIYRVTPIAKLAHLQVGISKPKFHKYSKYKGLDRMAGSSVFNNIAGTLKSTFRLGKVGPSLRQGTLDPNDSAVSGIDGDIYIQFGSDQRFYQRRGGVWIGLSDDGRRTAVTTATFTATMSQYYLGVNYAGNVAIALPAGVEGKQYNIKDESGLASYTRSITVTANGSQKIDGAATVVLNVPYQSVSLLFGGGNWFIL